MTSSIARREHPGLVKLEQAKRLLAECRRVDDVKKLRDRAQAVLVYQRQRGASFDAMNDAAEIKIRAECRLGELVAAMPKNRGAAAPGRGDTMSPRLRDLGIDKKESERWQKMARVPEPTRDGYVRETREAGEEVTSAGLLRLATDMDRGNRRQDDRYRLDHRSNRGGHGMTREGEMTEMLRVAAEAARRALHAEAARQVGPLAKSLGAARRAARDRFDLAKRAAERARIEAARAAQGAYDRACNEARESLASELEQMQEQHARDIAPVEERLAAALAGVDDKLAEMLRGLRAETDAARAPLIAALDAAEAAAAKVPAAVAAGGAE